VTSHLPPNPCCITIRSRLPHSVQKAPDNKVDQLWSCVFGHLIPISEGYLIVPRGRLDDTANAPDITIKQLKDSVAYTILTMENKRALGDRHDAMWAETVTESDKYLDLVPAKTNPNPNLRSAWSGSGSGSDSVAGKTGVA
jgi:hypothetical protein